MQLSKNLFSRPLKSPTNRPSSPLHIPEVFNLVLSYLDGYTIRYSVLPVCRQWYLMSRHRVVRAITWYNYWSSLKKRKMLRKLSTASRFYYYHYFRPNAQLKESLLCSDVLRTLERIDSKYQKHLKKRKVQDNANAHGKKEQNYMASIFSLTSSTIFLQDFTPLTELELYLENCVPDSLNTFYYPSSLTRLNIKVAFTYRVHCDLGMILQKCPLLEYFCAERFGVVLDSAIEISFSSSETGQTSKQKPFPLRSLILFEATFQPQQFMDLLQFLPNLEELKLKAMIWESGSDVWHHEHKFWVHLVQCLKDSHIVLDKVHFSSARRATNSNVSDMLLSNVYPQSSSERSLWVPNITPQFLQEILYLPSFLTTLEIVWSALSYTNSVLSLSINLWKAATLIHECLCDPLLLVHLTTLKTMVVVKDIDIFNRRGSINRGGRHTTIKQQSSDETLPVFDIWRCRGLRTLHLEYFGAIPLDSCLSRILYGYIARVCPALEELQICLLKSPCHGRINFQYHGFNLRLESGLCLLSRLQYLQRLRIFQDNGLSRFDAKEWELNWIIKSGRTSAYSINKRLGVILRWIQHIDDCYGIFSDLKPFSPTGLAVLNKSINESSAESTADMEIMGQMKYLGYFMDVYETLRGMDREFQPFPRLERLSFHSSILLTPEEELERCFPKLF